MAGLACGAVREERCYILTHNKGSMEAVGRRLRGILENDPPHIKGPSAFPLEWE